ncbi:MAG: ATP-dependent RecD-like DNA helicase [Clostridiales bacterium]|nr:ATP-dependent RecD-like DNA helicase [Clostridiales bacterium]
MDDAAQAQLHIEGTVTAVVFRNEENGYTVLRLDSGDEGEVTVVGYLPGVTPGEGLTVSGQWGRHSAYGTQFKAETVERRRPTGEKALYDYLSSGAIRGVGTATARRLVETFGSDVLTVLEETPELLTRIRGITRKRALAIGEAYRLQMGMRLLLEFLTGNGLSPHLAMPLYRRFGNRALDALRGDPYLLVDEELGVDFSAADTLAFSLGREAGDARRLEAGLLFELNHNLGNGHVFLPRGKLLRATGQLLRLEPSELEGALDALIDRGEVIEEAIAGESACYLAQLYGCECYVAARLTEMAGEELRPPAGLDNLISSIEREQGIAYAPQQRRAVELAARRQVILLTGGPGTGKTTSLRGVLALFDALGLETALAAPTGRAAKRLSEICAAEASTIHRLLETQFDPVTGQLSFARGEDDPLRADAVIVDETSMVDIILMQALLAALRGDCRLVLVGDPDQLPSVGPGNLLSDLIRSETLPTVRLSEVFRQAAESAIVRSAHQVNSGQCPDLSNGQRDFFFLRRADAARTAETIVELCQTRLPRNAGILPSQIQVLSPTRKHRTGTAALNRLLQEALNPPDPKKGERPFGDVVFRVGDRVMQVRNNYDAMWREREGSEAGIGIFNGDIGQITEISPKGELITVDFDGRLMDYTPETLGELEQAYAVTVHKAQGSEYRAVILAAMDGAPMLLTRGVLYTAITRARELFIIVGDERVVAKMAANDRQQRRYSGLRARLANP